MCAASSDSCTVVFGWSEQKLVSIGTELCDDIGWCSVMLFGVGGH
jgi:hypothetical protein